MSTTPLCTKEDLMSDFSKDELLIYLVGVSKWRKDFAGKYYVIGCSRINFSPETRSLNMTFMSLSVPALLNVGC